MSTAGPYAVEYDPRALKELAKLDKPVARRIFKAIEVLGADPRPSGTRPLVAYSNLWRIRGDEYCVVDTIKDASLVVPALRVVDRSCVDRSL